MAYTIKVETTPKTFIAPVGNPIIYSVSCDDITMKGFKWICDVYINNVKVSRLQKQPTNGNTQIFDVSNICKNELSYYFNGTVADVVDSKLNSAKDLSVILGIYTDASGFELLSATDNITIFNGYMDRNEFGNYQFDNLRFVTYQSGSSAHIGELITEYNERRVRLEDYGNMTSILNPTTEYPSWFGNVLIHGDNGIVYYINNNHYSKRNDFPAYPASIDEAANNSNIQYWNGTGLSSFTDTSIFQPHIVWQYGSSSTTQVNNYYDVSIWGTIESKRYRFNIDKKCNRFDSFQIAWLNNLGAFDFISFTGSINYDYSINKQIYTKKLGYTKNDFINDYTYKQTDFEKIPFETNSVEKITIETNWIEDYENDRIMEMIQSPIIFMMRNPSEYWFPVLCDLTNIKKQHHRIEKLMNYELSFNRTYIQRKQKM